MVNLESRAYFKKEFIGKANVEPEDVMDAVANIYQDELGIHLEDEAFQDMWKSIGELYEKHKVHARDDDELVDKMLEDLSAPAASNDNQRAALH
ncbi:MAG: hypothetical protein AB7F09_06545 [Parvibaculaceae bacterium]